MKKRMNVCATFQVDINNDRNFVFCIFLYFIIVWVDYLAVIFFPIRRVYYDSGRFGIIHISYGKRAKLIQHAHLMISICEWFSVFPFDFISIFWLYAWNTRSSKYSLSHSSNHNVWQMSSKRKIQNLHLLSNRSAKCKNCFPFTANVINSNEILIVHTIYRCDDYVVRIYFEILRNEL